MNFTVHFIRARNSLILSCSFVPFLLYYAICWNSGGKEENCGREGKGVREIDRASRIRRMIFHLLFTL